MTLRYNGGIDRLIKTIKKEVVEQDCFIITIVSTEEPFVLESENKCLMVVKLRLFMVFMTFQNFFWEERPNVWKYLIVHFCSFLLLIAVTTSFVNHGRFRFALRQKEGIQCSIINKNIDLQASNLARIHYY